jgi:hypothetical protein
MIWCYVSCNPYTDLQCRLTAYCSVLMVLLITCWVWLQALVHCFPIELELHHVGQETSTQGNGMRRTRRLWQAAAQTLSSAGSMAPVPPLLLHGAPPTEQPSGGPSIVVQEAEDDREDERLGTNYSLIVGVNCYVRRQVESCVMPLVTQIQGERDDSSLWL